LVIYDWKASKALALLSLPTGDAPHGVVSADGKTLAMVNKAGEVFVFDLSSVK